jgi:hypothetical protein
MRRGVEREPDDGGAVARLKRRDGRFFKGKSLLDHAILLREPNDACSWCGRGGRNFGQDR